jgi:hypothetical protein
MRSLGFVEPRRPRAMVFGQHFKETYSGGYFGETVDYRGAFLFTKKVAVEGQIALTVGGTTTTLAPLNGGVLSGIGQPTVVGYLPSMVVVQAFEEWRDEGYSGVIITARGSFEFIAIERKPERPPGDPAGPGAIDFLFRSPDGTSTPLLVVNRASGALRPVGPPSVRYL